MSQIITTVGLSKHFGSLKAVNNVNIAIKEGSINGVIGPNGSGKTTLFNLLSGYFLPTEGTIYFQGEDITHLTPQNRVVKGIGRSFQLVSIFPQLKVYENMVLSVIRFLKRYKTGSRFYLSRIDANKEILNDCMQCLGMVGLEDKAQLRSGELSYGDQRLLEIALTVALKPRLLLLDEPLAGLGDVEISFMLELLQRIKKDFTMVIVEHKITKIEDFIDELFVMSQGFVICQGKPSEVLYTPEVRKCYWGEVD